MEEIKLLQRVRGRTKGVATVATMTSTTIPTDDSSTDTGGGSDEAKSEARLLLASDFQAEVVVNPVDKQL
jgi:hypothetical protein